MINDPIVEEIRGYRKAHAEKYGNDLKKIVEALQAEQKKSNHKIISPGPKLISKKEIDR